MKRTRTVACLFSTVILSIGVLATVPCYADDLAEAAAQEQIVRDWMQQDHGQDIGPCFASTSDAVVETKMLEKVLAELGDAATPFQSRMDALGKAKAPGKDAAWKELYVAACEARRHNRLASLRKTVGKIVFAKHYNLGVSHYAYN